ASDLASSGTTSVSVTSPSGASGASSTAAFTVSAARSGVIGRVNIDYDGNIVAADLLPAGPGASIFYAISADGRYAGFNSVADTNGNMLPAVRDTCLGTTAPCLPSTHTVIAFGAGGAMSADARYVSTIEPGGFGSPSVLVSVRTTCVVEGQACN